MTLSCFCGIIVYADLCAAAFGRYCDNDFVEFDASTRHSSRVLEGLRLFENERENCMRRYKSNKKTEYSAKKNKRGYTLLELTIVLALTAIVATMVVSFSTLVSKYNKGSRADYAFFEDCAALKKQVTQLVSENDVKDKIFGVTGNILTIGEEQVSFSEEGLLKLGESELGKFEAIDGVEFSANDKLIKCTMHYIKDGGASKEVSFVFSLRCGNIISEGAAQND